MTKGFTLVEIAIVLLVVGLLIGGILKAQELIKNSQITKTISDIKNIEAGTLNFVGAYNQLPGDMPNPSMRLLNCTTAPCNTGTGNGDGDLESLPTTAQAFPSESAEFWSHLSSSDFITNTNSSAIVAWGEAFPKASIGGGYAVGSYFTGAFEVAPPGGAQSGIYLNLRPDASASSANPAAGDAILSGSEAAAFDRKFDDGSPISGIAIGSGAACQSGTNPNMYNEIVGDNNCNLLVRIDN